MEEKGELKPPENIQPLLFNFQLNVHSQNGSNSSVVLYLGLIISSVGLIIFLVGVGEKGFKSLELQLIGPSLIGEKRLSCEVMYAH